MHLGTKASSRRSGHTLRRADVAILLLAECWRNLAHSEDPGIVGKASDKGYQTLSDLVPKSSASSLCDSVVTALLWSLYSPGHRYWCSENSDFSREPPGGRPRAGLFLEIGGWLSLVGVGDRSPGQLSGKPWESLLP